MSRYLVRNDWEKSPLTSRNDGNLALMNNSQIPLKEERKS